MSYIGSTPTTQSFISGTDYFNGDGSTTAFTLSRSVVSVNDIEVVINNVVQQPNTAYTISGTTITFTSAPSAGTSNIYVRYLSTTTQSITPSQNTVSYSTLNSDTQSKLGISFKNRIINGAMVIDQRNAGASITPTNGQYALDRYVFYVAQASKLTCQQNAGSVTPPVGFTKYLGVTSSSAYSVVSGDYFCFMQGIEGFNVADLAWGTSNAKTVTLSFQVYSSLTGTFGGTIRNLVSGATRSYPFTYTISSANTWTQISVTIPGDTSGTWATNNTSSLTVSFGLGAGSTFSGAAGSWQSGNYVSATGATSVVGTNGATFYITGVQLEVGTQATTFDYRSFGTEMNLCQRYFSCNYDYGDAVGNSTHANISRVVMVSFSGSEFGNVIYFPQKMRTSPTMSLWQDIGTANTWVALPAASPRTVSTNSVSDNGFSIYSVGNTGDGSLQGMWAASAEL